MGVSSARPPGYAYPIGLDSFDIGGTANSATNTTGGTQTIDGTNAVHEFTSTANFVPSFAVTGEFLIIAGGGGGGAGGAGGGAGGFRYSSGLSLVKDQEYKFTIGGGGAAGSGGSSAFNPGTKGTDSSVTSPSPFSDIVSTGGATLNGSTPASLNRDAENEIYTVVAIATDKWVCTSN